MFRLGDSATPAQDWFATTPHNEAFWEAMEAKGRLSDEVKGLDPLPPFGSRSTPLDSGATVAAAVAGGSKLPLPTVQVQSSLPADLVPAKQLDPVSGDDESQEDDPNYEAPDSEADKPVRRVGKRRRVERIHNVGVHG